MGPKGATKPFCCCRHFPHHSHFYHEEQEKKGLDQTNTTTKNVIYDVFFLDAYIKCHYLFSKMGINDACIILAL